jgi:phosphate transport system protein
VDTRPCLSRVPEPCAVPDRKRARGPARGRRETCRRQTGLPGDGPALDGSIREHAAARGQGRDADAGSFLEALVVGQRDRRVSRRTAFFRLGQPVEGDGTATILTNPKDKGTLDDITGRFGRSRAKAEAMGGSRTVSDHILKSFDSDLEDLRRRISGMGGIAERMLVDAIHALVRRDTALAQTVIATDSRLDVLQREIGEHAILMIARRQPMAVDLREIISAIRISGDVERIGDLAKNVAKRALAIAGRFQPQGIVVGVRHMSDLVLGQLRDVLDADARKDPAKALDVWQRDGQIDALYTSLFRELLTDMMEDPRTIPSCTHLLFCAKNIERIGDHTTNIAETICYLVTGETLTTERPKGDRSSYAVVGGSA